jgi:uncharacterized membrane protein YccC
MSGNAQHNDPVGPVLRAIGLICAGLLFLALLRLPIGYYTFLRLAVTAGAVVFAYHRVRRSGLTIWVVAFAAMALLFNPIWPVYLKDRSLWAPIDILGGVLFLVAGLKAGVGRTKD